MFHSFNLTMAPIMQSNPHPVELKFNHYLTYMGLLSRMQKENINCELFVFSLKNLITIKFVAELQ